MLNNLAIIVHYITGMGAGWFYQVPESLVQGPLPDSLRQEFWSSRERTHFLKDRSSLAREIVMHSSLCGILWIAIIPCWISLKLCL